MNVALIIFNRPKLTARVLRQIAQAKPENLFVIADGPRVDRVGEADLVRETRAVIETVDWPCKVIKNYSDINLGCGVRPSSGISWVFEQVDSCIIVEDDCLPDPTFFSYCDELLKYYADDHEILMISGDNFLPTRKADKDSYHASAYPLIWGWATWRRVWQQFDFELKAWPDLKGTSWLGDYLGNPEMARYWSARFDYVAGGKRRDIWDVAWVFSCWHKGGVVIHPCVNLVENIGWDLEATHTQDPVDALMLKAKPLSFPLKHPSRLKIDRRSDRRLFELIFVPKRRLWERLLWRHTYGVLIRNIPFIGPVWAKWRQMLAARKTHNEK